jgi:hypothetical protein
MFARKRQLNDFTSEIEAHLQIEIGRLQDQGLSETMREPPRIGHSAT